MNDLNFKQTINEVVVCGVLVEKAIEFKTSQTGKEMATGHLVLACDTKYGKNEVRVHVLQFKLKADGTENSLYKGLVTLDAESQIGDVLKATGSLDDETYFAVAKGDFVENMRIRALFVNRVKETDLKNEEQRINARFQGYISNAEIKENGEASVQIIGIGYKGIAVPLQAVVEPDKALMFMNAYQVGCSTTLFISIVNSVVLEEVQKEAIGFGEAYGEKIRKVVSKKIIFGGEKADYGVITEDQVKQALAIREAKLQERKQDALNRANNTATITTSNQNSTNGFGGFNSNFGGFKA